MPNYVRNNLEIIGHKDHVKSILDLIQTEDDVIDYNRIIPMPEEIRHVTSPVMVVSEKDYKDQEKKIKGGESSFRRNITRKMQKDYLERFGADNWYDWALTNWGTKWGSFHSEMIGTEPMDIPNFIKVTITYETAWSAGAQVIWKLSMDFPAVTFKLTYADEDAGSNCARITFKDGNHVMNECTFPEKYGTDEAMEIYFEMWGGDENWEKVDGEWKYIWNE